MPQQPPFPFPPPMSLPPVRPHLGSLSLHELGLLHTAEQEASTRTLGIKVIHSCLGSTPVCRLLQQGVPCYMMSSLDTYMHCMYYAGMA